MATIVVVKEADKTSTNLITYISKPIARINEMTSYFNYVSNIHTYVSRLQRMH